MALFFLLLIALAIAAFLAGRAKASTYKSDNKRLHSRPYHYGLLVALRFITPATTVIAVWYLLAAPIIAQFVVKNCIKTKYCSMEEFIQVKNNIIYPMLSSIPPDAAKGTAYATTLYQHFFFYGSLLACIISIGAGFFFAHRTWQKFTPRFYARQQIEKFAKKILLLCASVAILVSTCVVISLFIGTGQFFTLVPVHDFLFGLNWAPQIAIRADQVAASGHFGALPVLFGTFFVAAIALIVAVPPGLLIALYLSEYANSRLRTIVRPLLEIFSGIPTVVYGFFAAFVVAPFLVKETALIGIHMEMESALAAGLVVGLMILPYISSLSEDVLHAIPQELRNGSLGLGATQYETVRYVVLPAAMPGIASAIFLAFSRAVGETMIAFMVVGMAANITLNPLEPITTVTVQIVTLLVGNNGFNNPKALAVFALGLLLFILTMIFNLLATRVVKRYRQNITTP